MDATLPSIILWFNSVYWSAICDLAVQPLFTISFKNFTASWVCGLDQSYKSPPNKLINSPISFQTYVCSHPPPYPYTLSLDTFSRNSTNSSLVWMESMPASFTYLLLSQKQKISINIGTPFPSLISIKDSGYAALTSSVSTSSKGSRYPALTTGSSISWSAEITSIVSSPDDKIVMNLAVLSAVFVGMAITSISSPVAFSAASR